MTPLLACASHLLVDLPLFGGPVFMLVAAVILMTRAERRRATRRHDSLSESL
jgi:cytochrome c-type biogenesis protein CcmH/NrfF